MNSLLTSGRLWRVTAPHFVAGIVEAQDGAIVETAPVMKWAGNWSMAAFRSYCVRKGWKCEVVNDR